MDAHLKGMKGLDFVKLMYQGIKFMRMKCMEVKSISLKDSFYNVEEEQKI